MTATEIVTACLHYAVNIEFHNFKADLKFIISQQEIADWYADELCGVMRRDFKEFFFRMDKAARERFVEVAMKAKEAGKV